MKVASGSPCFAQSADIPNTLSEDGFLRGAAVGNRATDLVTEGAYRNFDLQFEWKIAPGGNSGVKYLVGSSQKLVFAGGRPPNVEGAVIPGTGAKFFEVTSELEYQIVDEERHPDGLSYRSTAKADPHAVRPLKQ